MTERIAYNEYAKLKCCFKHKCLQK